MVAKKSIEAVTSAVRELVDSKEKFGYDECIIAAVLTDSGLYEDMKEGELEKFVQMARDIAELHMGADEPRFCLYDYLDACVESRVPWTETADYIHENFDKDPEEATSYIVRMAEYARDVYST